MLNTTVDFQHKSSNCGDCELCTQTIDNRRVRIQSSEIQAIESIIDSHIMIAPLACSSSDSFLLD